MAQGKKAAAPAATTEGKMMMPVSPAVLPGEEKLSARERVERDMLMPPRRKKAAALQAASDESAEAKNESSPAEDAADAPSAPRVVRRR